MRSRARDPEDAAASLMPLTALLLFPFRGQGGLLSIACAVGLYVPLALLDWSRAFADFRLILLLFLPLPIVTALSVLQLLAWATLQHIALGHVRAIESISIEDVSPWRNPRAFQVALLVLVLAGTVAAVLPLSVAIGGLLGAVVAFVLPAILGVVVLEQRILAGLNPERLAHLIRGLGVAYAPYALALACGVAALIVACIVLSPPQIAVVLAATYLFLLGHVLAGRVLYLRRNALGLATVAGATPVQREQKMVADGIDALMLDLHRLCMSGRLQRAIRQLEDSLRDGDYALDEHVHQRLQVFLDRRLLVAHCERYAARLVAAKRPLPAWLVLRTALDVDADFRSDSADVLLAAVDHAPVQDARRVVQLLENAERSYAGHPRLAETLFALARCHAQQLGQRDEALILLARIDADFPGFAADETYRATADRLRRHA